MKLNKLLFGLIAVLLLSCAEEDPFMEIEAKLERLNKENSAIEKVETEQTPIIISWNKFQSGMLEPGRIVVLEGYIDALPRDIPFLGKFKETHFSFSEKRNQIFSNPVSVNLPVGTSENEKYPLPEAYKQTDLKVVTNNSEIATASSHVRVTGVYKGYNVTKIHSIQLKEVNLIEPQFDESIFIKAIELTDENINDQKKDNCYAFMDVRFNLDRGITTPNHIHYWIYIEQKTNSYLHNVQMLSGFRPGTINPIDTLVYDINGEEIKHDEKVRLYGVFRHSSHNSKGFFTVEEVVKL